MCPQLNQPAPARERSAIASARHTPGPWNVGTTFPTMIWSGTDETAAISVCATRTKEDARLIAAAPDMLAALKAIVIESGGKAIPNDSLTVCRKRALAAIAKAEG